MKKVIIPILLVIIIALSGTSIYFYNMYKESQTYLVEDYYRDLKIVNGTRISDEIFKEQNGQWWIKADAAMKYIDPDMYYSGSGKRVYMSLDNMDLMLESRELTSYMTSNLGKINIPVRSIEGIRYLSLDQLEKLYAVRHHFYSDKNTHLMVSTAADIQSGIAARSTEVLAGPEKGRLPVGQLNKGELVNILSTQDDYKLVMSSSGIYGYVPDSVLPSVETVELKNGPVRERQQKELLERTRLVWEQIHSYEYFTGEMAYGPESGLDVLSPTWFSLNVDGIVLNIADQAYVDAAHDKGLKVWALLSNSFDPDWTHDMLSDKALRKSVISQMIAYSAVYNLDGINIDFENVYLKDKDLFTEFVAELSEMLHQQGMVVSIDVTVPWGSERYSLFADRPALAKSVDYVMLMAYDEHWASIQSPGSVASRDWIEKGIIESLELIPKDKLILGLPFYSRVWSQIGNGKVSSKALGFNGQKRWLEETGTSVVFDESTGQNYAETSVDGVKKKIWLEDETSLKMRIDMAKKYDLPGVAGWSLLFTTDDVWEQIEDTYPAKGGL